MSLLHTPYDGSSVPFSVGLKPISESEWLEQDERLEEQLLLKKQLLAERHDRVFQAEADTDGAQTEVLTLVLAHLREHGSGLYTFLEDAVCVRGETIRLDAFPPLEAAARLLQEDLVLMRKGDEGYRIAAACLCFPSSWSLLEKFSQSMRDIHANVPGFNDGRMGAVVGRLFENLRGDQLVCRFNWSVYDDDDLHHPESKQLSPQIEEGGRSGLGNLFIRVERQTLRRLPVSGDILFTIKIHHDPLMLLESHSECGALSRKLRSQLLALSEAQLAYKGLSAHRDLLADELGKLSK